MPLLNYTTQINSFKTVAEIQQILVKHGAKKIMQDYDSNGGIVAVEFLIPTPMGEQGVRLPANIDAVDKVLQRQKVKGGREQAERVAWRIVKDWVEAQMAILESQMVSIDEVFLPYIINPTDGQTIYQLFQSKQLLLRGGNE